MELGFWKSLLSTLVVVDLAAVANAAIPQVSVALTKAATGFDTDNSAFYYNGASPSIVANDGGAATGGFRVFGAHNGSQFSELSHKTTGRSKVVTTAYTVGNRDLILNIPAPDSILRSFDANTLEEITDAQIKVLGDWSTLCTWQNQKSGNQYLFLFGKKKVVQFLIRNKSKTVQILEVQTITVPIEGEFCTASSDGTIYFSGDDAPLYSFQATESTSSPTINTAVQDIKVQGLAVYVGARSEYLFVGQDDTLAVFSKNLTQIGTISLTGIEDLEIKGSITIHQTPFSGYPSGAVAFSFEGEDATGIALFSLDSVLSSIGITPNTKHDPSKNSSKNRNSTICDSCSNNGYCSSRGSLMVRGGDGRSQKACECFAGFTGSSCSKYTCKNECSSNGSCVGPNVCKCRNSWTGPDCSLLGVEPKYETDANGGDGDDPAIWISPEAPELSTIITTTKSQQGQGLGVFNLKGELLQLITAEEPNNVDVIYSFKAGNRTVDLAYAGCRGDNTMCLFEIGSDGLLKSIAGGVQPTEPDYKVYGSCTYRSRKTDKQYLFVNSKEAIYLQYELSSTANGTLQTTLARSFSVGTGGQVEGCVTDEENGYLILGEEQHGIWRYDAEPDSNSTVGYQVAQIADGHLEADVEGITLVPGKTANEGFYLVSSQGISSYLVYERAPPHNYVLTFTIVNSADNKIDHVSNTDGLVVVGNRLNDDFPHGLVVTHDDANELATGGTGDQATFKLVSLADILGADEVKKLKLLEKVDQDFDPRAL